MEHKGTIEIETQRLILRKFKPGDEKQMFKNYTASEKVTEFLTWRPHKSQQDTKAYLDNIVLPEYEDKSTYRWAIVLKEIGEVIGCIDVVDLCDRKKRAELGWVIGDAFWGKGIMPEAGAEVLKFLFELGFERIQAFHHIGNPKSGRVMQKIGMRYEGTLRNINYDKDGNFVDCALYAILSGDYYSKNI